jgi:hypothetical protein
MRHHGEAHDERVAREREPRLHDPGALRESREGSLVRFTREGLAFEQGEAKILHRFFQDDIEAPGDGFQVDGGARGLHSRRQQPHVTRPGQGW